MGDRDNPMSLSVTSGMIAQDRAARLPTSINSQPASANYSGPIPLINDDVRAVAAALTLCAFLWALKAYLIGWFRLVKGINPLSDAPIDGVLALGGEDLLFCAMLAVLYRIMFAVARRMNRPIGFLLRAPATFAIHALLVVFSVASFEVVRIYGWPLDVSHLRSADDPRIIASSIGAYAGLMPFALILVGLVMRPLLGRLFERILAATPLRTGGLRLWGTLAGATVLLCGTWALRLHQIDTFGVKQNAVAYFVQHYRPAPGPIQVQQTMRQLASELGDRPAMRLEDTRSLVDADGVLQRDFPFATAGALKAARGMNLLVIQLESTSAAYLDEKTTPNLMRLAKAGLSFRNHATVFTETTRATYGIYYSDYMIDLGTTPRMLYGSRLPQTSLMDAMHDAGYQTGLFHSGFLSYADESFLFENKPMDRVVDATVLWDGNEPLPWSWGVREEKTVDALTNWIAQRGDASKPFFAIYSTEFPHHPYACPTDDKPYAETGWLNRYRNSLHYADKSIGTLLDRLSERKLLERTVIVVMGDHGETVSTYPVGHGLALTREEVFTPFIISNPTLFPSPLTSRLSTNHLDIAPTVAGLLGAKVSPQWLGRNVLAEQMPARVLFIQAKLAQIHGVIDNGLLYVYEAGRQRGQLFDTTAEGSANWPVLSPTEGNHATLVGRYKALDETFQKWAVWRHLARATGQLDEAVRGTTRARQRNASAAE
jgi:hypothetical protein